MKIDLKTRKRFRKYLKWGPGGCLIFTGLTDCHGYGRFYLSNQKSIPAHHVPILITTGEPIPDHLEVHHICRNKQCVHPDHQQLVTHAEHMRIHAELGIWDGEKNGMSKLSNCQARHIRRIHEINPKLFAQKGWLRDMVFVFGPPITF